MACEMNFWQKTALDVTEKGHNVYIGGQAGVGKSFLVQQIVESARKREKEIALTCTTGIACSVYPMTMNPMTIHKWSGIGDGRYIGKKMIDLLLNDEQYASAYSRIKKTDILIIDEILMFSKQMMDNLNYICSVKDHTKPYGGIQIVVVGDFKQLPPVRNTRYGDLGNFCFESENWPCHSIFLTEVIRQTNLTLINCIQKFSVGVTNSELNEFCKSLARPIGNENSTKLFSNNTLVDMFNRECKFMNCM